MNQTLKIALGATLGGAVGYFAASVVVEYMRMVEEAKNNPYDLGEELNGDEEEDEEESRYDQFKNNQRPIEMSKQHKTIKVKRTDYTAYFDPEVKPALKALAAKYNDGVVEPEAEAEEEVVEVDDTPEVIDIGDDSPITIIGMSDFANSQYEYEQVTLTYYTDDIVTDEQDNPINEPEKFLGDEALVSFGLNDTDENVVYVRNHDTKTEYEIIHARCSYSPQKVHRSRRVPSDLAKERDEGEED